MSGRLYVGLLIATLALPLPARAAIDSAASPAGTVAGCPAGAYCPAYGPIYSPGDPPPGTSYRTPSLSLRDRYTGPVPDRTGVTGYFDDRNGDFTAYDLPSDRIESGSLAQTWVSHSSFGTP